MSTDYIDYKDTASYSFEYEPQIRLEVLLRETDLAYRDYIESGGPMEADYAAFAAQSLSCFRQTLNNPGLSEDELSRALRKCYRLRQAAQEANLSWSRLTAAYLFSKRSLLSVNDG